MFYKNLLKLCAETMSDTNNEHSFFDRCLSERLRNNKLRSCVKISLVSYISILMFHCFTANRSGVCSYSNLNAKSDHMLSPFRIVIFSTLVNELNFYLAY